MDTHSSHKEKSGVGSLLFIIISQSVVHVLLILIDRQSSSAAAVVFTFACIPKRCSERGYISPLVQSSAVHTLISL